MTTPSHLGERLRQVRERAGLDQKDVGTSLGIAREIISYWENNRRLPGLAQLERLADLYGTTTAALLGEQAEPTSSHPHTLLYRGLEPQDHDLRAQLQAWLRFLDRWAELLDESGQTLPGRQTPPKAEWHSPKPITDSRRARTLAAEVREHYHLGEDAVPDLQAFLDHAGVLVNRASLTSGDNKLSGVFYNHPRLGYCILVNADHTPGRQQFTLAHELAHALFHYQTPGLICRAGDQDPKERFADAFAGHFLVNGDALRGLVTDLPDGRITDHYDVARLQPSFRVSYATLLYRLFEEGLITQAQYDTFKTYSPLSLARRLGLEVREYQTSVPQSPAGLGAFPPSVLEKIVEFVHDETLSLQSAAALLGVPVESVLQLLARPEAASPEDAREFEELPSPPTPRRAAARRAS
ncbi:helix-turn-helix domain-containing protein [Deinococcus sp. UYEF24]